MTTVVGVRFREVGKIYYFAPGDLILHAGDNVIVDTVRGTEFGTVIIPNNQVEDEEIVQPLKVVRRLATKDDEDRVKVNREKEKEAFEKCKEKIKERGLEMKLISAEYTFDNSKVLFYFTADGRIDFRELVKDLAAIFKIRIELRQVGVRDETKLMGGLGGCGRPLCCASYLSDFVPVSIRMAKEQNLSLNPQKISGVCGRLMCCLKNEADTYEDLNTRLPKDGGKVKTKDGREGIAETVNILRERVRVLFTDEEGNRELEEFPASELIFTPRRKARPVEEKEKDICEELEAELLEEELSEADPELEALEEAELDDIEAEESRSESEDANRVGGQSEKNKRRRRHRRRRPSADKAGEEDSAQAPAGENRQKPNRQHGNHDNRQNDHENPQGDGENRHNNHENGENKNGVKPHRRKRFYGKNRRPSAEGAKTNTES